MMGYAALHPSYALTGGVGGYFGDVWSVSRVAANSVAGGVSSELQGGRFGDGFLTSGVMSGARYAYNSLVGYDATWAAGENREGRTDYIPSDSGRLKLQDIGRNIIGFNENYEPNNSCIFCANSFRQGSPLSRALNVIPGGNAIAGLDDYINNVAPTRLGESAWFKLVTIPTAVGVTIPALFDRVPGYRPQDLVMH
ncbi:MAG: hypothetical protein ACOY4D_11755 [Pseudomonadota bacterium]